MCKRERVVLIVKDFRDEANILVACVLIQTFVTADKEGGVDEYIPKIISRSTTVFLPFYKFI